MKKHRHQASAWLSSPPASQFWKFYEWKMSGFPKPHEFSPWFCWVHSGAVVWSVSSQTRPPNALSPHDNLIHDNISMPKEESSYKCELLAVLDIGHHRVENISGLSCFNGKLQCLVSLFKLTDCWARLPQILYFIKTASFRVARLWDE